MNWSPEQSTIFSSFADVNSGNLVVLARAGTGKTTTIVQALTHVPAESRNLLTAFNKKNAQELGSRLMAAGATNAEARTLHSLGFSLIRRFKNAKPDSFCTRRLIEQNSSAPDEAVPLVARLMSKAKNCLLPDDVTVDALVDLAYRFDIFPNDDIIEVRRVDGKIVRIEWDIPRIAQCAENMLKVTIEQCNRRGMLTIDFDDMIWLPLAWGLKAACFDTVVVDECQDMSPTQLALAKGAVKPGGRLIAVGDDRQAIYAFRGADTHAMQRMPDEMGATVLHLPTTYRCPQRVVEMAQAIVPDFRAHEGNGDGIIERVIPDDLTSKVKPGCFVLSRSNRGAVAACMKLLRAGISAEVIGRDIGKSLLKLLERIAGKRAQKISSIVERINTFEERERERIERQARSEDEAQRMSDALEDKIETLRILCEGLVHRDELFDRISKLFGDGRKSALVTCSTIHKAKGMERDLVVVLEDTMLGAGEETQNIRYVAITRTRRHLILVSSKYKLS